MPTAEEPNKHTLQRNEVELGQDTKSASEQTNRKIGKQVRIEVGLSQEWKSASEQAYRKIVKQPHLFTWQELALRVGPPGASPQVCTIAASSPYDRASWHESLHPRTTV